MRDYRVIPESEEGRAIVAPLSAPLLVCETTIEVTNPEFCWGAVDNATEYEFQLSTSSTFAILLVDATGLLTTCYTYVGTLDYDTTYYWRVRAKRYVLGDLYDISPWSLVCSGATGSSPMVPPTLTCESIIVTDNPEFCWAPVPTATSYDFQLASDALFTTIIDSQSHIAGPCTTYVGTLTELSTYYWRVRAIRTVGGVDVEITAWSLVCTATTGVEPLDAPTLICVATIPETDPEFCWNAVTNATEYDFQLSRDVGFTDLVEDVPGLVTLCHTYVGTLSDQDTYYWRVRAVRRIDGVIVATSAWSLTCIVSPEPVFFITGKESTTMSMLWRHYPAGTTTFKLERVGPRNNDTYPYDPYTPPDWRAVTGSPLGGGSSGTYTETELLPGYHYYYRLTPQIGGVDQSPVLTDDDITNPNGALSTAHVGAGGQAGGGGMQEETGPYTVLTYPYGPRTYYGGIARVENSTIEFNFRNDDEAATGKIIWGRKDEESWGVGSIMGYTAIEQTGNRLTFYLGGFFGDLFRITSALTAPAGETHHWAFVMMHNLTGAFDHKILIYRDGVLDTEHNYTTSYRVRVAWIGPATLYAHKAWMQLMFGVKGAIDELRIWDISLNADIINAIKGKVVRSDPHLLYRWGFDNYTESAGDREFERYGSQLVDPQRLTDVAGGTPTAFNMKHIVEPLIPETVGDITPPVPVLLTPAHGSIIDPGGEKFTWLSVLSDHDILQIATDILFTNIIYTNSSVVGGQINLSISVTANTALYWRVRAVRGANMSAWSDPFLVVCDFEADIILTEPQILGRNEPYDAAIETLMTQPVTAQADEPITPTIETLMTQPISAQADEPITPTTETLMTQPIITITDI